MFRLDEIVPLTPFVPANAGTQTLEASIRVPGSPLPRGRTERAESVTHLPGSAAMSAPFVIAVPAKGRLQENAQKFFARAGLDLVKPRGARDYRGTIANLPGVEVAYLSASEITDLLGQGLVHFGVT